MKRSVLWKVCSSVGAVADEIHFELDGQQVQRGRRPSKICRISPVDAVDIDLEVVEIGPAALGQKVGHDHGLVRIGEPGQFPGIVPELLLGRRRLQPGVADLARAHEAQAVAHLHDQRRGRASRQIDRLVARSGSRRPPRRRPRDSSRAQPGACTRRRWHRCRAPSACRRRRAIADRCRRSSRCPAARTVPPSALGRRAPGTTSRRRTQTVATGVAGEPTAPGRRSGGAVSRKRERFLSRSHSARSFSHQISPRLRPSLNRQ